MPFQRLKGGQRKANNMASDLASGLVLNESFIMSILCSDSILEYYSEYFKFIKDFVEVTMSDVNTSTYLTGPGYDHLPIFRTTSNFGNRQFMIKPCTAHPTVYLVHNKCCVLMDHSIHYKSGKPVLLYASPAKLYDSFRGQDDHMVLHLSCQTYSVVQREDVGLPLRQSIVVKHDSKHVPKFHLSSQRFSNIFSNNHGKQFLLSNIPPVPLDLRTLIAGDTDLNCETAGLWYDMQKAHVGSLLIVPALRLDGWPSAAEQWGKRSRKWPDSSTIQQVMNCDVFLVPNTKANIQCDTLNDQEKLVSIEEEMSQTGDILWVIDFSSAEHLLLSHIGQSVKKAFLLFQYLLSKYMEVYSVLKNTLLWCLEEDGLDLSSANGCIEDMFWMLIRKLQEFLEAGHVPHYFMPSINLLDDDTDLRSNLTIMIISLRESPIQILSKATGICAIKHLLHNKDDIANVIDMLNINTKQSLVTVMEDNTRLLATQFYQKLHDCSSIPLCIKYHQEMLFVLSEHKRSNIGKSVTQLLMDFVHSSLGNMYVVHALESYFRAEKLVFYESSKRQFSLVSDKHLPFNVIRSMFILLKMGQFQQVIDALGPFLQSLIQERTEDVDRKERNDDKLLPTKSLLETLNLTTCQTFRTMDILIMKVEKPSLPLSISKNLTLAYNQLLGCTKLPVSTLDQVVISASLLAEAFCGLKNYDLASQTLQQAEDFCLKDEFDLNEKRGCVYLNVLADGYVAAKDVDQGRYLLERSIAIMPNPRNPGRWKLLSIKTQRAREFVIGGFGVAVATAVAAVTINFLMTKK